MVTEQAQRRFSIDINHYVVDKAHPNQVKKFKYYRNPKDSDSRIRQYMLRKGIERLLPKLIVGSEAGSIRRHLGDMLLSTLEASQLNSQDPLLAIQYPFKGKLGSKKGMQDNTSISLFVRDVERLLRELYGDFDRNELSMALYATRGVVKGLLTF